MRPPAPCRPDRGQLLRRQGRSFLACSPPARCRACRRTAPPRSGTAGRLLDASGCRGTPDGRRRATPEAPITRPALMPAVPSAYVTLRLASFRVTGVATGTAAVDVTVISLSFRHGGTTGHEVTRIDAMLEAWQSAATACVGLVLTVGLGVHVDVIPGHSRFSPSSEASQCPPHARWHPSGAGSRFPPGDTKGAYVQSGPRGGQLPCGPLRMSGIPHGACGAGPDTRNRGVAEASRFLTSPGSPAAPVRAPPRRRRAAVGWLPG